MVNALGRPFALIHQYDRYPDKVLDVKEFANVVRDVRLLLNFACGAAAWRTPSAPRTIASLRRIRC